MSDARDYRLYHICGQRYFIRITDNPYHPTRVTFFADGHGWVTECPKCGQALIASSVGAYSVYPGGVGAFSVYPGGAGEAGHIVYWYAREKPEE